MGAGLTIYGTWLVYVPAAYLVSGIGLLYIASGANRLIKAK